MTLDPACQAILKDIAAAQMPPLEELGPDGYRAIANAGLPVSGPELEQVEDLMLGGIPGRLYRPCQGKLPGLVFYHGGGWVAGTLETHDSLCRVLAKEAGCVVISVDYRLAPEHPYPAPLDDCVAALRWVADHADEFGVDGARLAVGGDSAGGNLAAVVARIATRHMHPILRHQLLIYPVTNHELTTKTYIAYSEGYLLTRDMMEWFWSHYAGSADRADPNLSPLQCSDLARLPPATIVTAEFDPLCSEGGAYAQKLKQHGVSVSYLEVKGVIHGFVSMIGIVDAAMPTIEFMALELKLAFKWRE